MIFNDLYRKYFAYQAQTHPEVLHQPGVDKAFDMITIEEAVGGFRERVQEKGYIIRAIMPTYQISDLGTHEVRKHLVGGFVAAHHYSNSVEGVDYLTARDMAEKLGDEIIERMIADSANGHPLFYKSLNKNQQINVSPVAYTGDSTYTGWMYIIRFANFWRNCVNHANAPEWVDGPYTPKDL